MKSRFLTSLRAACGLLLALVCPAVGQAQIITGFAPASGPIGTSVTITGSGFNATAAQNVVFFGATRASVTTASPGSLTVTVPLGATYRGLSVANLATGKCIATTARRVFRAD